MSTSVCSEKNIKQSFLTPFISLQLVAMEGGKHEHYFVFNSDGIEVCIECGICTKNQEMISHGEITRTFRSVELPFSEILINNHIGYIEEIEENYKCLKNILKRGYQNIVLFAFCTYNTLLKNHVYYSLLQISDMFRIPNFAKKYCQIKKKSKFNSYLFHLKDAVFINSALSLFLAEHNKIFKLKKTAELALFIDQVCPFYKQNLLLSSSLFLTLKTSFPSEKYLFKMISNHFSINPRTLKKNVIELKKNPEIVYKINFLNKS